MHDGSVPEWPIQNARALPTLLYNKNQIEMH